MARFLAVLVLVALPLAQCAPTRPNVVPEPAAEPLRREDAVIDLRDGGTPMRRIVPLKPEEWQKRPPCPKEMGEREINGACYFRIHPEDMKPPCLSPALEHGEFCWRAVARLQRDPASLGRR